MPSPNFSLSLNEFPGILDVPPQSDEFLGAKVVNALRQALEPHPIPSYTQLEDAVNKLRHGFAIVGDEHSSMAFADLMLALSPGSNYALDILSDWQTEPENVVRALLNKANRFKDLPSLYANCLKRSSEHCQKAELLDVGRTLFLAWQGLPTPNYPELDWIIFPFPRLGSALRRVWASRYHTVTTSPEEVEDAQNGWRDGHWNPISPQQEALLLSLIKKYGVQPWSETIMAVAQNGIRFEKVNYASQVLGASRLGGLPDVPQDWVWPEDLEFLAQINLKEVALFDVNHALPSSGLLRIFAGNIWSGDIHRCQIEWDETPVEQLHSAGYPSDYYIHGFDKPDGSCPVVYSPIYITPCCIISVESYPIYEHYEETGSLDDDFSDDVDSIQREFLPSHVYGWNHQLLGSYDDGQKEAYDQRQSYSSTGDKAEFRRGASEWTLLFQIDSNDDLGTHFSDAGTVYFLIHREDLAARRFDRIFVTMTNG